MTDAGFLWSRSICLILVVLWLASDVMGQDDMKFQFQETSPCWAERKSSSGTKWAPRNAHATTVFNDVIYLTGGKSDFYEMYKNKNSIKRADVWYSLNGADWVQKQLSGDFYIQNWDALQPGSVAPWYERFGHTLDAIDLDGDGVHDYMVQIGGFAPDAMRDMWVTTDGEVWVYCGEAPFHGRGWHSSVIFQGKLHIIGGSPLNSEVWRLESVTETNRVEPDTRAAYLNYTYEMQWTSLGEGSFSPRAGATVVSQTYFNTTANETQADSRERMVLVGGYGGFLFGNENYDGYRSRGDVWTSYDGVSWERISNDGEPGALPARAWTDVVVLHYPGNVTRDVITADLSPRLWVFGGGYIGDSTSNTRVITTMDGLADAYFSRDGKTWTKVNYEQGEGTRGYDTYVQYFSSQEWTVSIVDSASAYLGLWGHTLEVFNGTTLLIGGDKDRAGSLENKVYENLPGMFCDLEGQICSNSGFCRDEGGCQCPGGLGGEYCEIDLASGEPVDGTPLIGA